MLPVTSYPYLSDCLPADAKLPAKRIATDLAFHCTDVAHVMFCKSSPAVFFPTTHTLGMSRRIRVSPCLHLPFFDAISKIVRRRTKEEMRRIDAESVIPSRAVVAHPYLWKNWPVAQLPGNSVGIGMSSGWYRREKEISVATSGNGTSPQPAAMRRRGLINFCPEAFGKCARHDALLLEPCGVWSQPPQVAGFRGRLPSNHWSTLACLVEKHHG